MFRSLVHGEWHWWQTGEQQLPRMVSAICQFSFVILIRFLLIFQCVKAFLRYNDRAMSRDPLYMHLTLT